MSAQVNATTLTPILQSYSVLAIALAAGPSSFALSSTTKAKGLSIGTNISTTIVTVPALLKAPEALLATQWKVLYDHGITPVVSLAMSSGVGFAVLAFQKTPTSATSIYMQRNLYIAAAITAFGLAPYTRFLMWNNIGELERRADYPGEGKEKEDTRQLVETWAKFNLWRGVMLLSSASLGIWACVS
jgi:hypothetical protein